MKTIEKIIEKHFPHDDYYPDGDFSKKKVHDRDCFACKMQPTLIELSNDLESLLEEERDMSLIKMENIFNAAREREGLTYKYPKLSFYLTDKTLKQKQDEK